MEITEFRRRMIEYEKRARDRQPERVGLHDDTPWYSCVIEEMCIDMIERIANAEKKVAEAETKVHALEAILSPEEK